MHDPRLIKNSILRKLGLEGGCDRYLFYHENGKHSGKEKTKGEKERKRGELKVGANNKIFLYRNCFDG
jgi:hypothetical protein